MPNWTPLKLHHHPRLPRAKDTASEACLLLGPQASALDQMLEWQARNWSLWLNAWHTMLQFATLGLPRMPWPPAGQLPPRPVAVDHVAPPADERVSAEVGARERIGRKHARKR